MSDGYLEILLISPERILPEREEVDHILRPCGHILLRSRSNEFAHPYTHEKFWEMAFPTLFPFGRGRPRTKYNEQGNGLVQQDRGVTDKVYMKYSFMLGKPWRSFQKNSAYYFSCYYYHMSRNAGKLAMIASTVTKSSHNIRDGDILVGEMQELIGTDERQREGGHQELMIGASSNNGEEESNMKAQRMLSLSKRLIPYSERLMTGTALHISKKRREVLCLINSPVVTHDSVFMWFATNAFADVYNTDLHSVIEHDSSKGDSYEGSITKALQLSKKQRERNLSDHPALVARVYALRQEAFWNNVLRGEAKPLGLAIIRNTLRFHM